MSLRALALDWSVDGSIGIAFLVLTAAAAGLYLSAAAIGSRRDRRRRRWPRRRTACFMAGLAALVVDLYSGIGTLADTRLSVHMVEHMVIWLVAAPLLAAGAPVRLALFALHHDGRRRLAGWLHSRVLSSVTSPAGSVSLFAMVLLVTHVPVIYGLALTNDYVHVAEHALYLVAALVMWAPLLGVDPLPHRLGPRGQVACLATCMVPMALIALWLGVAARPVYGHYVATLGPAALHDQRVAAAIMWIGGLPAFAVPAVMRLRASAAGGRRRPRGLVETA
ncbi:MAG TPA: cytochrome c oxidase assembly protein [Solirubrobacteraceae bacterium]|jgi:cytochrome c oxidase assembly factor CtaG|nr:cytochrome c oxidase assembly protein [Solirubrobacteraceae bacterium]